MIFGNAIYRLRLVGHFRGTVGKESSRSTATLIPGLLEFLILKGLQVVRFPHYCYDFSVAYHLLASQPKELEFLPDQLNLFTSCCNFLFKSDWIT
mgnify:CR=1 FL=1